MTRDDILRMAREAGFRTGSYALANGDECVFAHPVAFSDCIPELERFAAMVAAAEREDCAKLCEQVGEPNPDDPDSALGEYYRDSVCYECAEAIRARGQQ